MSDDEIEIWISSTKSRCHETAILLAFALKGEAMKRNRLLWCVSSLSPWWDSYQGCSRGPSEEELKLAAFQEQFSRDRGGRTTP